jgi:membrane-bound serine protease (ClpP class)
VDDLDATNEGAKPTPPGEVIVALRGNVQPGGQAELVEIAGETPSRGKVVQSKPFPDDPQMPVVFQGVPTGAERLGAWINAISPILLILGAVGLYIEFKTPGFGAPGIVGIAAFALYFIGGYIAGFSGFEWMLVFVVGVILLALEFFVFPGTVALGVVGAALMVLAVFMALIDLYPGVPTSPGGISWPTIAGPTAESMERALRTLLIAVGGVALSVWLASRWLPKTSIYGTIVSHGVSGAATSAAYASQENALVGRTGVTISPLRPGGKAQFGESILDVTSQGDMIAQGQAVRIVGYNTGTPIVASV